MFPTSTLCSPGARNAMPPQTLLMMLAAAVAAGCGGGEAASGGAPAAVAEWTLREEIRIGSLEGEDALSTVRAVVPGPEGRIYVLLPQEGQVAVFDEAGARLSSVGRAGEGPGELTGPSRLGFLGDTLWVQDARLRRLTFYTPGGEHLGDLPFPTLSSSMEGETVGFGTLVADGRALLVTAAGPLSDRSGSAQRWPLLVTPLDSVVADTVATRNTAHERAMSITTSGGAIQSIEIFSQVFADHTLWETAPDGRSVVLVERAVADRPEQASYRVTRVSLEGDTAWSVDVPYMPRPVDPVRVDSLVDRYVNERRSAAEVRELLFLPDHLPPASDVVVGADGMVWVAREAVPEQPRVWDIFDDQGRRIAQASTPSGVRIEAVSGNTVWAVETDELDVPYVLRLQVEDLPQQEATRRPLRTAPSTSA